MAIFRPLSMIEQVAAYLRTELAGGRWKGAMPGVYQLVEEIQVSRKTVDAALQVLEKEGLLAGQGAGKRRKITLPKDLALPSMRVQILLYEEDDRKVGYFLNLQHRLLEAGFVSAFADKTLLELGMDEKKVARFVKKNEADAWIVVAGSREVLQWFAGQPAPAFAIFGRIANMPLASSAPKKAPALISALNRLTELGHRRIVMLAREERRTPVPGFVGRLFLGELEARGIPVGPYNLPDWEDSVQGFHDRLDSLFGATPPTALMISVASHFFAAMQYLSLRGIHAPRDVSLICFDPDPGFAYCQPAISHINWDPKPLINVVMRWANQIRKGKNVRRTHPIKAEFIEGGTVGPAPAAGSRK